MTMVFGSQKLNDQLFCVQEERDFFQTKYLEQVSELQELKQQLAKTKKEVVRLRQELMDRTPSEVSKVAEEKKEPEEDTASCLTEDEDDDVDEKKTEVLYEEDKELRDSAQKLLQWASYRSSTTGRRSAACVSDEDKTENSGDDVADDDVSSLSSTEQ